MNPQKMTGKPTLLQIQTDFEADCWNVPGEDVNNILETHTGTRGMIYLWFLFIFLFATPHLAHTCHCH